MNLSIDSRKASVFIFCPLSSGYSFVQKHGRASSRIVFTSYVCLSLECILPNGHGLVFIISGERDVLWEHVQFMP